jgi:two-component system response regulator YesN
MSERVRPLSELLDLDQVEEQFGHFSALTDLSLRLADTEGTPIVATPPDIVSGALCRLAHESSVGRAKCAKALAFGGREAHRWGGPYHYQCWLGLMEWTVPLLIGRQMLGVLACGQVLIKDRDDLFYEGVIRSFQALDIGIDQTDQAIEEVPIITPQQCHAAAEMLQLIANQLSLGGARQQAAIRRQTQQQQRIAEAIGRSKNNDENDDTPEGNYPIELEKRLMSHVRLGEVATAKEILNKLLGVIFFRDMGNQQVLKARLIELLTILSRAAVGRRGERSTRRWEPT